MKTAYIAGKMRGLPDFGFPIFDKAKRLLEAVGWKIVSPADLDRESGFDTAEFPDDYQFSNQELRQFVRRDVDALLSLRPELGDALILLDNYGTHGDANWVNSLGAVAEFSVARWLKLPVYVLIMDDRAKPHLSRLLEVKYAINKPDVILDREKEVIL